MISWCIQHGRALRNALARLARSPVGTLLAILVIGVTLCLPTGLYHIINEAGTLGRDALHEPHITIFMAQDADAAAVRSTWDSLQTHAGVQSVRYISSDEALAEMKSAPGLADALSVLDKNPLPHTFVVTASSAAPDQLDALSREFSGWAKVERVQLDSDWARRLAALLVFSQRLVMGIALVMGLALLAVIVNTVRLQILSARDELEVSHLMGATRTTIRRPFLYFGFLQGLSGAAAALGLMTLGLHFLNGLLADLMPLFGLDFHLRPFTLKELLLCEGITGILGWVAAFVSVTAYLPRSR
jgi:cell division transport system permease protein